MEAFYVNENWVETTMESLLIHVWLTFGEEIGRFFQVFNLEVTASTRFVGCKITRDRAKSKKLSK